MENHSHLLQQIFYRPDISFCPLSSEQHWIKKDAIDYPEQNIYFVDVNITDATITKERTQFTQQKTT